MITPASSLSPFQAHVAQAELERGLLAQSATNKCLLMGEEVGGLFKAMRKSSRVSPA
ncbi:MAG: hypothetical protein ACN6OP_02770 [Pseudomonadales bacterium]